jgi:hypothetical protein
MRISLILLLFISFGCNLKNSEIEREVKPYLGIDLDNILCPKAPNIESIPFSLPLEELKTVSGEEFFFQSDAYHNGFLFSGTVIKMDENAIINAVYPFMNGKLHGAVEEFDDKGFLIVKTSYNKGNIIGPFQYYLEKVKKGRYLFQEGYIVNGDKSGLWLEYYPNGNLRKKSYYHKNALLDLETEYDDNGVIRKISKWVVLPDGSVSQGTTLYQTVESAKHDGTLIKN